MKITESEYRQLQAEIDADAKAQTARIEQERIQNHQALERVYAVIRRSSDAGSSYDRASLFSPTSISGNGSSNGNGSDERAPFAMKHAIRNIIRDLGDAKVTQPLLYREVCKRHHLSVAHRKQQHVKGQIAGILSKLAESNPPELEVVDAGHGRDPRVYKATENLK
jgi:hypothetical protein